MIATEVGKDLSYSAVLVAVETGDEAPGVGVGNGDYAVRGINNHSVHGDSDFIEVYAMYKLL
ncbi:hypothetical protein NXY11_07405 [Parabacteroides faecis]|uniref:hypothetical protein n=1 Tax=Parabacteroides faecis TaxID=1217282 RepID=UPI0021642D4A|nr:hypothetical protein [Parabacteroides faecis]MCS2893353.1 hypothetical protein [Parabacteroides faecis]UVQ48041.1 hypothetical protein NXY11_07405 [Parabacteroides faecis]